MMMMMTTTTTKTVMVLYREIFIRPSQTREERLLRANMKTILAELPKGKEYRLTAHGRIVRNRDDYYNQSEQQSDVIRATNSGSPSRKGNLGHEDDPDCESQNVEHAETKPKFNKQYSQSDDLMETEEIKSQADLDPTPECSEQMNAIDTTVSFKLIDDEIDDMKLSIAKALKGVLVSGCESN